MAGKMDKVVVINELEAFIAHKYFDVPYSKISTIPIIVNDVFFKNENKKAPFHGLTDYVLCTGNICRRKNQLNLVKACKNAGLKLVLMGNILTGEERYGELVEAEMDNKSMLWLKGIKENSIELIAAYQNCSVFALPSLIENSPISVFEALASGCKVVLADRKYSYQSYFKHVQRVNPNSVDDIAGVLLKVIANTEYSSSITLMDECKSGLVGLRYKELYNSLVN
jgi:glycosyltransferase involved in cell wall biosynthesis